MFIHFSTYVVNIEIAKRSCITEWREYQKFTVKAQICTVMMHHTIFLSNVLNITFAVRLNNDIFVDRVILPTRNANGQQ